MLKIILNPDTIAQEQTFSDAIITIGIGKEGSFDLALEDSSLQGECVQIIVEYDTASVINLSSQKESITINGQTFETATLRPGDTLQIGQNTLSIDEISAKESSAKMPSLPQSNLQKDTEDELMAAFSGDFDEKDTDNLSPEENSTQPEKPSLTDENAVPEEEPIPEDTNPIEEAIGDLLSEDDSTQLEIPSLTDENASLEEELTPEDISHIEESVEDLLSKDESSQPEIPSLADAPSSPEEKSTPEDTNPIEEAIGDLLSEDNSTQLEIPSLTDENASPKEKSTPEDISHIEESVEDLLSEDDSSQPEEKLPSAPENEGLISPKDEDKLIEEIDDILNEEINDLSPSPEEQITENTSSESSEDVDEFITEIDKMLEEDPLDDSDKEEIPLEKEEILEDLAEIADEEIDSPQEKDQEAEEKTDFLANEMKIITKEFIEQPQTSIDNEFEELAKIADDDEEGLLETLFPSDETKIADRTLDLENFLETSVNIENVLMQKKESEEDIRKRIGLQKEFSFADEDIDMQQIKELRLEPILPEEPSETPPATTPSQTTDSEDTEDTEEKTSDASSTKEEEKEEEGKGEEKDEASPVIQETIEVTGEDKLVFGGIDFDETPISEYMEDYDEQLIAETPIMNLKTFLRKAAKVSTIILLVLVIGCFSCFLYAKNKYASLELKAAQGLADMTMVLLHEKMSYSYENHNIKISKAFLASQLDQVIPEQYLHKSPINNEGNYTFDEYNLKIYLNDNLTRFILVAEPIPSIFDIFVPKKMLAIDNENLQVRNVIEPEIWQRRLKNLTSLDKVPSETIHQMLSQTRQIGLASLDTDKDKSFSVPEEIRKLYPGTENFIYNAPRYYKFTLKSVNLADEFYKNRNTTFSATEAINKAEQLRHYTELLTQYENIIIYSPLGKESILEAAYVINMALPKKSLLFGYITFNPDNKLIKQSEMIDEQDIANYIKTNKLPSATDIRVAKDEYVIYSLISKLEGIYGIPQDYRETDTYKGIRKKIEQLSKTHKNDLKDISDKLEQLVIDNKVNKAPNFDAKRKELIQQYKTIDEKRRNLIASSLDALYAQFLSDAPKDSLPLFQAMIQSNSLEPFISANLAQQLEGIQPETDLQQLMQTLQRSKDLIVLDHNIRQIIRLLTPDNITDPMQLISLKNNLRQEVLKQLNSLLLSPQSTQIPVSAQLKSYAIIEDILNNAEITEYDVKTFYLNEFDNLMSEFYISPSEQNLDQLQDLNKRLLSLSTFDQTISEQPFISPTQTEHYNKEIDDIRQMKQTIKRNKDKISSIPLTNLYAVDPNDKNRYIGRIGQQMLVQASTQHPNELRDERLSEAIDLLLQAIEDNRALWADILEARRLLTEGPEQNIRTAINSDVGFTSNSYPLYLTVKTLFKEYIDAKSDLSSIVYKEQFNSQYSLFRDTQQKNLETILQMAKKIENVGKTLKVNWQKYITNLKDFLADYEIAKEQGFFTTNTTGQNMMIARLKKKVHMAEQLQTSIDKITTQLIDTSILYQHLVSQQIEEIANPSTINKNDVSNLLYEWENYTFPNLLTDDLANKIINTLDIEIRPIIS